MEWRYYGPMLMAVVLFLLVGTIFERRIEAAIRRIIEHRQRLLESQGESSSHPVQQTTEGTQHSCTSSDKTLDYKSSFMVSENTLDYESFPNSSSKKTLDCQSSCAISEKYIDYNSSKVINKPIPEFET